MDRKTLEGLHRAHVSRLAADTAQALRQHGFDALVVHSGSPQKRTQADDQYWPLRVTPEFQHWLPLSEPGCALVVEAGRKPRLLRLQETNFWEAPAPAETDHFWGAFDVAEASSPAQMRDLLPGGRVAFIGDAGAAPAVRGRRSRRAGAAPHVPRRDQAGRRGDAVQEHRRTRRALGHAAPRELLQTRPAGADAAGGRRRVLCRLLLGRDPDLGERWGGRGVRLRGAGRAGGGDAAAALRAGAHGVAVRGGAG